MSCRVTVTQHAAKQLGELPAKLTARIVARFEALGTNPRPNGSKKLHGEQDVWRIRIGDYRAIYRIQDTELVVIVLTVGHRREIYRK